MVDRLNPATAIAGGEGGGAWELHQVRAHLWVGLAGSGVVGGGGSAASRMAASEENGGEVTPVGIGRGGGAGELRGPTVELTRGSARVEEGYSGGPAAVSSSSELRWAAELFWGVWARSWQKSGRIVLRSAHWC